MFAIGQHAAPALLLASESAQFRGKEKFYALED